MRKKVIAVSEKYFEIMHDKVDSNERDRVNVLTEEDRERSKGRE